MSSVNENNLVSAAHSESKLMELLSTRISQTLGLHYPPARWSDLRRGLRLALPDSGDSSEQEFIARLAQQPWTARDVENLAFHLTIGETYFWREPQTLTALQDGILPALLEQKRRNGRRLRLWSAGCCTGEEPYSLAMLLHHMLPDIRDWDVQILATDLNSRFLEKALKGRYRAWSFRGTPQWLKERYFHQVDAETYQIVPEIARMVQFRQLNLANDSYPSPDHGTENLDVVFCRNVLIYMEAAQTQAILNRFTNALNPGGWLALSATETWLVQSPQLVSTTFGRAILFQKTMHHAPPKIADKPATRVATRQVKYSVVSTKQPIAPKTKTPALRAASSAVAKLTPTTVRSVETVQKTEDEIAKARACANRGQNVEALRWCDQALEGDKLAVSTHYLRASILQETGDLAAAMQALSHAIFLEPNFVMAHFSAGNLALQAGKRSHAARHFNNAATLLRKCAPEEIVPESDDLTAAHLLELIRATLESLS